MPLVSLVRKRTIISVDRIVDRNHETALKEKYISEYGTHDCKSNKLQRTVILLRINKLEDNNILV